MSELVASPLPSRGGLSLSDRSHEDPSQPESQVNTWEVAWRARWLIVIGAMMGVGAGWALLQRVTPRYTSASQIYVQQNAPPILSVDYGASFGEKHLYTQAELIRSGAVLSNVVERPDIRALESIRNEENPIGFIAKELVVAVSGESEIISVSIELPEASDAAQIVNAVIDEYIASFAEQQRNNSVDALRALRAEKHARDAELEQRRKELDDFRRQHVALLVQVNNENVISRRFASLSEELNQTELELMQVRARYNRVKRMHDQPTQRPYLLELSISERSYAPTQELQRQVRQLEQSLIIERATWGNGYPRVRMLTESLDTLKSELAAQEDAVIESYVDSLKQEYDLISGKKEELQRAYDKQFGLATEVSSQAIRLESLIESVERATRTCDTLDTQIKEVDLSEEVGGVKVSIINAAAPASDPSYPVRQRFLATGCLLGGLLGFGLAYLRDLLDQRLKSIDDIRNTLQLPVVGALPLQTRDSNGRDGAKIVATRPRSIAAEAVRTLRTALSLGLAGPDAKVFVVTSPAPGDGKSTVASNLAIAMAQADQKVLLIDADLRKPTQDEIFGVMTDVGLASALTDRRPIDEAIVPSGIDSLDLLPCGPCPANPVELLNNGYFASLLESLSDRYDRIVIDSPPVLPVADSRIIAALADCTLIVLRAERTTRRAGTAARDELWRVKAERLGVVVNGVPLRKQTSYGYGDTGYGYGGGYGSENDIAYGYPDETEANRKEPAASRRRIAHAASTSDPADDL